MNQVKKDQMDRLEPFLLEYFKYLREEINLRIVKHSRLLIYKLIAVGAILAFILNSSARSMQIIDFIKDTQYLIWIVPLICINFDMLILGNLRVVRNIGIYILENYEKKAFKEWKAGIAALDSFVFWEEAGAHDHLRWRCYTKLDMSIIFSITFFLIVVPLISTLYLLAHYRLPVYRWNLLIGITLIIVSLFIYVRMLKLVIDKKESINPPGADDSANKQTGKPE